MEASCALSQSSLDRSQIGKEAWTRTLTRQYLINIEGINFYIPMIKIEETVIDTFFKGYREIAKIKEFINAVFEEMQFSWAQALEEKEERVKFTFKAMEYLPETDAIQRFFRELLIDLTCIKDHVIDQSLECAIYSASTEANNPFLVPKNNKGTLPFVKRRIA